MIADQFRRVRKEKKMSQRDVAERMGVSHQSYQQYEAGTRQPKMSTISRIAEAMDVDPIVFLDDDMLESMELSPESESEVIRFLALVQQQVQQLTYMICVFGIKKGHQNGALIVTPALKVSMIGRLEGSAGGLFYYVSWKRSIAFP